MPRKKPTYREQLASLAPITAKPSLIPGAKAKPKARVVERVARANQPKPYVPKLANPTKKQRVAARTLRARNTQRRAKVTRELKRSAAETVKPTVVEGAARTHGWQYNPKTGVAVVKRKRSLLGKDSLLPDEAWAVRYKGSGNPYDKANWKDDLKASMEAGAVQNASSAAPVIKVLEQTTRPVHGVAGGARAALRGENVPRAVGRGLANKDKVLFSDVLKEAGAPKWLQGAGGFALDVAADPTTYVTFGAGSVAKQAGLKAATQAAEKAAKAGMSQAGVATVKRAAVKRAEAAAAPKGKGLTVKFAGKELPGVRTATAAVGRGGSKVSRSVPGAERLGGVAKDTVRDVRPSLRPAGASEVEHVTARQAARRARAKANKGARDAEAEARDLRRRIPEDQYGEVIARIEAGPRAVRKIKDPEVRRAAQDLQANYRGQARARRQAGVLQGEVSPKTAKAGEPRGYFPHARDDVLTAGQGARSSAPEGFTPKRGGSTIRPGSAQAREIKKPLQEANRERPEGELFSTNVPLVHANYTRQTAQATARGGLVRDLASAGRRVKSGEPIKLRDGEAVYHVGVKDRKYDIREVPVKDLEKRGLTEKSGQYVILNREVVESAKSVGGSVYSKHKLVRGFDKTTRGFKRVATFTPGFHFRNFIGDTQLAYMAQPGHRLPVTMGQAGRALAHQSRGEVKHRLGKPLTSDATIKIGGKRVPMDDFLREAEGEGVIRSGYVGRELEDLVGGVSKPGAKKVGRDRRVKRWMQNREDLQRLATYKHYRDQGLRPGEAADKSLEAHIDYGDLTSFEKTVARRTAPFYTFTARALPFQAKRLVTNPGKAANVEKLREETGNLAGLEDGGIEGFPEYKQRQIPMVVRLGGKPVGLSAGLPLTLLNELPTTRNPIKYAEELGKFGMSMGNPVFKNPVEYLNNYSFFFRDQLERDQSPLVAAPVWVRAVPKDVRQKLGIVPDYVDKKTGKKTWGWPGKVDYLFKMIPGIPNIAQQLMTPAPGRSGRGQIGDAVSALSGVKADPHDPVSAKILALYATSNEVAKRLAGLRQRGVSASNPNAEYAKLREHQKMLDKSINALSLERGDAIALKRRPGRKAAAPPSVLDSGGSGESLFDSGDGAPSLFD